MSRLIVLVVLVLQVATVLSDDRVKVSVYYESLCSDSKKFITTQLYPTYHTLSDIMNVELIPFGNANYTTLPNGTVTFICQHGPHECYGNLVEVCAINTRDVATVLPFINCAESDPHPDQKLQECAVKSGFDWTALENCALSTVGEQYLVKNGEKTNALNPPHTFIPWIIINDVWTTLNQDFALLDLKYMVCKNYKGNPKPAGCSR